MGERFKLSNIELYTFALEGVQTRMGINAGNPDWTREDWEFHYRSERELRRRLKIAEKQEKKS